MPDSNTGKQTESSGAVAVNPKPSDTITPSTASMASSSSPVDAGIPLAATKSKPKPKPTETSASNPTSSATPSTSKPVDENLNNGKKRPLPDQTDSNPNYIKQAKLTSSSTTNTSHVKTSPTPTVVSLQKQLQKKPANTSATNKIVPIVTQNNSITNILPSVNKPMTPSTNYIANPINTKNTRNINHTMKKLPIHNTQPVNAAVPVKIKPIVPNNGLNNSTTTITKTNGKGKSIKKEPMAKNSMNPNIVGGSKSVPNEKDGDGSSSINPFGNGAGFGIPGHIADPTVVKAVHNVLSLLQVYGPLTHDQLEYNLPPMYPPDKLQQILDVLIVTEIINIVDEVAEEKKKLESQKTDVSKLNDLNVKVKVEVKPASENISTDKKEGINDKNSITDKQQPQQKSTNNGIMKESSNDQKKEVVNNPETMLPTVGSSSITTSDSLIASKPNIPKKPPRYVFLDGMTRTIGDAIFLPDLLPSLERARVEMIESEARIKLLKEALQGDPTTMENFMNSYPHPVKVLGSEKSSDNNNNVDNAAKKEKKKTPRELLLSMVEKYPSILEDQVYATALKNFNC